MQNAGLARLLETLHLPKRLRLRWTWKLTAPGIGVALRSLSNPASASRNVPVQAPRDMDRFTAARRPASFHAPVLEVGDAGCLDGPDLLEPHLRVPEVLKEASTVAEQHRNDVELEFVQ